MKKILIVIHDMKIGGAQKSQLSFLKCLMASEYANEYDIHLMMLHPEGPFCAQIPPQVKVVAPPAELLWMSSHLNAELFRKNLSWKGLLGEARWILGKRLRLFPGKLNDSQKMWECWKGLIPRNPEYYDVAVSYIDGTPNYYVMDKINAGKKLLWFHSEYQKHGYCADYDRPFLGKCCGIVTISEKCRDCLLEEFPEFSPKIHILENITVYEDLLRKSRENCSEFEETEKLKLLTVGRLHPLKGIDLAIEAAKQLQLSGVPFLWLVVGDGPERERLQKQLDTAGISDCFRLIGSRDNPYPYMAKCDILVQPSRVEGKSIVLDEAKLLLKPIVATDYVTVKDSIDHGENGWVVEMTGQALCEGIIRMHQDVQLRSRIVMSLQKKPKGNEEELNRYMDVMFR